MTVNGYNLVEKTVDDQAYTFNVPAFEGSAEDIADRYGIDALAKAFCTAKFPTQSVVKMLKDGNSPEQVQEWLDDWAPGSRTRLSPAERLMREADKLGVARSEIESLLQKAAGKGSARAAA